jgi:hypothetical protein
MKITLSVDIELGKVHSIDYEGNSVAYEVSDFDRFAEDIVREIKNVAGVVAVGNARLVELKASYLNMLKRWD